MIIYVLEDLFTSPADVLVNTVNTVGVMGKGIAKEFKRYFPEMFSEYQVACEAGSLRIGTLQYWSGAHKSVLNFPTKRHWKSPSRIEDIEEGLKTFVQQYQRLSIGSIAFPQLGCGNGELDWHSEVKPIMEGYLGALPIPVYIHLYDSGGLPEHHDQKLMKRWLRSEPRSLAFVEVWSDLRELIGHSRLVSSDDCVAVSILEEGDSEQLAIAHSGEVVTVDRDDLMYLWMRFRSSGILAPDDLPDPYRSVGIYIFELLRRLPYVEPVRFSLGGGHGVTSIELVEGLRFVPPPSDVGSKSKQLELAAFA